MKKPRTKYLKLYKQWMRKGVIPNQGLCASLGTHFTYTFEPSDVIIDELRLEGMSWNYWGSGLDALANDHNKMYEFTPLRQTMVLFLAAMNNEL